MASFASYLITDTICERGTVKVILSLGLCLLNSSLKVL